MYKFTHKINGWEVSEKGQIVFSEIKTLHEAIAITKAYWGILTEFKDLNRRAHNANRARSR